MPNESGFVDFKQYADLNSDEEQARLDEAVRAAEAQDDYAQKQLIKVRNSTTDGDITHSASYSDYLVAKQNAAKAWAAANMSGSDPRSGALRGSLNKSNNVVGRGQAVADERNRREGVIAKDAQQSYVAGQRNKAAADAYYAKIEADKKARAEADKKSKSDFYNSIRTKQLAQDASFRTTGSWGDSGVTESDRILRDRQLSNGLDAGEWGGWGTPGLNAAHQSAAWGGISRYDPKTKTWTRNRPNFKKG